MTISLLIIINAALDLAAVALLAFVMSRAALRAGFESQAAHSGNHPRIS
jgi:hypothetical protein